MKNDVKMPPLLFVGLKFLKATALSGLWMFVLNFVLGSILMLFLEHFYGLGATIFIFSVMFTMALLAMTPHFRVFTRYHNQNKVYQEMPIRQMYKHYIVYFSVFTLPTIFLFYHFETSAGTMLSFLYLPQMSFMIVGTGWLGHSVFAYLMTVGIYAGCLYLAVLYAQWQNAVKSREVAVRA